TTPTTTSPTSTAALNAMDQIERLRASLGQSTSSEKKNTNLSENNGLKELPVIAARPKNKGKTDLIERLATLTTTSPTETPATETENSDSADDEESSANDESYQWEWRNPELANTEIGIRPSDIKQAILQEKTPELIEKVIQLSTERDEWAKTIEALDLDNLKLVKQVVLNSVLLNKDTQHIKLGLRSNQQHLIREKSLEVLQQKLSEFYQTDITIDIELNDDENLLTPLDHRRQIYQELSEQARLDLQKDKQLKLLQQAFDAKLDMASIRPV
ncbi:DNA polymerase III subunit gamma/tau C-terminal domain-containing protein, partial [Actinobacillus porcinus]